MSQTSSKFLIGITQRIDFIADRGEYRDALDQKLIQWVVNSGFVPVSIPNILADNSGHEELENWLQATKPDGLILSGGNDIDEYQERDATEKYLLSWAKAKKIPALGICRGLQMMAIWAGTNLSKVENHVGTRHHLVDVVGIDEWPETVNSYHNWRISDCPHGFVVTAKVEDGSIEAIQHIELPWEGWMWHPEREAPFSEIDNKRLRRLFGEY